MLLKTCEKLTVKLLMTVMLSVFCSTLIISQTEEYPVGVFTNLPPEGGVYPGQDHEQIEAMGVNGVVQFITEDNRLDLQRYENVIGINTHFQDDYIAKYASGYYSRWQAVEDVCTTANTPGIKHEFGIADSGYWRSGTDSADIGKYLVTGPDYFQNRNHRFWPIGGNPITYNVNFRLKIDGSTSESVNVCKLQVVYYAPNGDYAVLVDTTLTANDLSNTFSIKELTYTIPSVIGSYEFTQTNERPSGGGPPETEETYNGRQGVRFNVIWLGNRELYVDYIEVYDHVIGVDFVENMSLVVQRCSTYAANYPQNEWANLKYWYGLDELQTIDNFEPYRIVDSILNANNFPRLITTYYPEWDGKRDYEIDLKRFVEQVEPERVMYYYYPYWDGKPVWEVLEMQRVVMQQPWTYNFDIGDWYFVAQAFGFDPIGGWRQWRKPTPEEMRATVNLALAHGAKGMYFWNYYSDYSDETEDTIVNGLIDTCGNPTNLYYEIQENIAPRLRGTLGNTLLNLDYTGEYAMLRKRPFEEFIQINADYLTLTEVEPYSIDDLFFYAGLLKNKNHNDKKYFFICNLLTNQQYTAGVNLSNSFGYNNINVKEVENGIIDETFNTSNYFEIIIPAGDGYLFKVAPVVKYGG